jgi:mycofactocin system creatininase family protein
MTVLGDVTSPDLAECEPRRLVLAVPVGATEQHGPHLPLSTDTDIAAELCRRLADSCDDVVVAPALSYGASGEHAGFAGTLSIGTEALELVLVELGRSATETFGRVVFVNGHGGNVDALGRAVDLLVREGRDVLAFSPRWDGDAHAGRAETAMLLALSPARVHTKRIAPGDTRPLAELLPELRSGGLRTVTATGVLGDPTGATAVEGEKLLASVADDLVATVAAWRAPAVMSR